MLMKKLISIIFVLYSSRNDMCQNDTNPLSTGTAYVLNVIYARREQLKALSHMKLD